MSCHAQCSYERALNKHWITPDLMDAYHIAEDLSEGALYPDRNEHDDASYDE